MKDLILIRGIVMRARKEFNEMWDIPRLYVSACSNAVQMVPFTLSSYQFFFIVKKS
jgi:hypothetical protein